ncbi:MAG: hypothetical protein DMG61_11190 [Acidobacteria bacterium]|nr:MAG: hypothetical protein DMG61_11190 [Acidobacteriota bacterium]
MILNVVLASSIFCSTAIAQSAAVAARPLPSATPQRLVSASPSRYRSDRFPKRAKEFYQLVWGVDSLSTKSVESGEMIRFSYRVLDAEKAKGLNDKKAEPYLVDEKAHVKLVVPTMEKVGQLRQSSTPETGKAYWMVFSNKGRLVRPGDRVNVVIGNFRANGLMVQ